MEFDEYVYLGPYLYEKAVNGNIHVAIKALLSLGIISVTIVSF